MTATLLLSLDAPIQSWVATTGNKYRRSDPRPTKTAIIGLVANALGRDRDDDITDLAALDFAVRRDRAGRLERDHRSVGDDNGLPALPGDTLRGRPKQRTTFTPDPRVQHLPVKNAKVDTPHQPWESPAAAKANPKQITDVYLADAAFTVALTGDDTLINTLAEAIKKPARALFLGKKAHPPARPLYQAVTDDDTALGALTNHPPEGRVDPAPHTVWYTANPTDPAGVVTNDQPLHFGTRPRYGARVEATTTLGTGEQPATAADFFA